MTNIGNLFGEEEDDLTSFEHDGSAPLYPEQVTPEGLSIREHNFVIYVAQGRMSNAKAYREAGYTQDIKASAVGAHVLLSKPKIQRALTEERVKFLKSIEMGKDEYVGYLTMALRTPVNEIDGDHPLCQEVTVTTVSGGDGPEILKTTYKMYSKQHASDRLAKVMGWDKPQEVLVGIDEKVAGLISLIRGRNNQ